MVVVVVVRGVVGSRRVGLKRVLNMVKKRSLYLRGIVSTIRIRRVRRILN